MDEANGEHGDEPGQHQELEKRQVSEMGQAK
jgi:hypothetical protein